MNAYEKRLDKLINSFFGECIKENVERESLIGELLEKRCKGKLFAVWGAGEHTEQLYKSFPKIMKQAACIIDSNIQLQGIELYNIPIISKECIASINLETIIISSYASRKSIRRVIDELDLAIESIDLYEYLEEVTQHVVEAPYYVAEDIYIQINELLKSLIHKENIEEREKSLYKIIYLFLTIKDFYYALIYLDEIIELNSKSNKINKALVDFKIQLNSLLSDLKKELRARKQKDMFLMLFDSIRAKDMYNQEVKFRYLHSALEKEYSYFTQVFATSIYTYESISSMFTGKLPFEEEQYKAIFITQEESPFIVEALNKNYAINIYTQDSWPVVKGKDIKIFTFKDYIADTLWKGLTDLVSEEKEALYFLYFLRETHPPHMCPLHKGKIASHVTLFATDDVVDQTQEEYEMQCYEAFEYVDKQMEFYGKFMPEYLTQVIFSDHGQIIERAMEQLEDIGTLAGWHDERIQTVLLIKNKWMKPFKYENLFSLVHMNELLIGLLNHEINIIETKSIEVDFEPVHKMIFRENYIKVNCEDYIDGYKVIRNKDYKVVKTGTGKVKLYQLKKGEEEEITQDKEAIIKEVIGNKQFILPEFERRN